MTDPVTRFEEIAARHDRCFWLDGGGSREWSGRRSLLGWLDDDDVSLSYDARTGAVTRHTSGRSEVVGDDVFTALEAELAGDGPGVHWVGYFGYASRPDLPAAVDADDPMPTAVWMRATQVEVFEHAPSPTSPPFPLPTVDDGHGARVPGWYAEEFRRVREALEAGHSYEINLTHRVEVPSALDPVSAYLRLRELNPAPYAGFLQHQGHWLLSSSPERFATVDRCRALVTKPIKGTMPRGDTPAEDERLRALLATDPKNRAENLMIVDLLRNDLGMVCEAGTVEVPELMTVETYASVHQLVSSVRGRLREDISTAGALRALFPAGSMTGAPKLRTMELIEQIEATPRGVYAGAFGWICGDGRADLGVVIRSLTTSGGDTDRRTWQFGTGGGLTVRSTVEDEWAESLWKAQRLRQVLDDQRQSSNR